MLLYISILYHNTVIFYFFYDFWLRPDPAVLNETDPIRNTGLHNLPFYCVKDDPETTSLNMLIRILGPIKLEIRYIVILNSCLLLDI